MAKGRATIQATNLPTFDENPLNRIIIALKKPKGSSKVPVVSNIQIKACLKKGKIKVILCQSKFNLIESIHCMGGSFQQGVTFSI